MYGNITRCQPYLGNEVDICGVLNPPTLKWDCKSERLYTIFLIDINPYGRAHPKVGHNGILWFVVDVPGCSVVTGKTLYQYQAPTPLYGAGKSRYAVLVYEQPSYKIDWSEEPIVATT